MSALLSPQGLGALVVTLIFAAVALQRPSRAVLAYAILGSVPVLQLGAFSGRTISQGMLLAEVLATVLAAVWFTRQHVRSFGDMRFEGPLLLFGAVCAASMAGILMLPDHRVAGSVSNAVSFGQLLLVAWPLGIYFASAEFIDDASQLQWLQRAMLVLALAQFAAPFAPKSWSPYMGWVPTFGLFAAPFAMATFFATPSLLAKIACIGIALVPLVRGVLDGKAFLYGFVGAAAMAILWLRASKAAAMGVGAVAVAALFSIVIFGDEALSAPLEILLDKERNQMSYGGDSGRGSLAVAALSIWQEAPILGVGPGNSYVYMLQRSPIGTPHNQYLNILVEFGALGLVTWLFFLAVTFREGLRVYRLATHPVHRTFALAWIGTFAGMVAGGITGDFMVHSIRNGGIEMFSGYYLQWVLLGGLAAIPRLEQRLRQRPAPAAVAPGRRERFWRASPPRQLPAPAAVGISVP